MGALVMVATVQSGASAAPGNPGESARALIVELEKDDSARELVGPALGRAKDALAKAAAASPTRTPLLEATALEWAEVARDLVRASTAERASDRLEQDTSATQTEIARVRAAVEQTLARVGRARQELKELERGGGAASSPGGAGSAGKGAVPAGAVPAGAMPLAATPNAATPKAVAPKTAVPKAAPPKAAPAPGAAPLLAPATQGLAPGNPAPKTPPAPGAPR